MLCHSGQIVWWLQRAASHFRCWWPENLLNENCHWLEIGRQNYAKFFDRCLLKFGPCSQILGSFAHKIAIAGFFCSLCSGVEGWLGLLDGVGGHVGYLVLGVQEGGEGDIPTNLLLIVNPSVLVLSPNPSWRPS
jgi:hypothetical protein